MGCQLILRVSQRVTASPAIKPKPYCNTHAFSILNLCPSLRNNVDQEIDLRYEKRKNKHRIFTPKPPPHTKTIQPVMLGPEKKKEEKE